MRPAGVLAGVASVVLLLAAGPASATMVERMPLARVTKEAGRIVQGRVVAVRSGRDRAGLPATWITFDVSRTLKGRRARRLTIKQYGAATPLPDGTVSRISGLPRYAVGEEAVVFLRPASRRGFTSPVGLGQGVYRVVRRPAARALALGDLPTDAPADLDELLGKVTALVRHP
jgi:hypothetical protein